MLAVAASPYSGTSVANGGSGNYSWTVTACSFCVKKIDAESSNAPPDIHRAPRLQAIQRVRHQEVEALLYLAIELILTMSLIPSTADTQ